MYNHKYPKMAFEINLCFFFKFQVISTRKVQTEDGTLFLDMKCGNLMQQRITRIQTDQVRELYHI